MPAVVLSGVSADNVIGRTGSRPICYSAISGTAGWYVALHDGTHLRTRFSSDGGASWGDDSSNINGGGSGPNDNLPVIITLLAAQSVNVGTLHLMFSWDNGTGNSIYQQRGASAWFANAVVIDSSFSSFAGALYETGGHVYLHAYGRSGKYEYGQEDPSSGGSAFNNTLNYAINQPDVTATDPVPICEIVGSNEITVSTAKDSPNAVRTYVQAATAVTGSSFPTPTSRYTSANLLNHLAGAVDGTPKLHIIKFVTGTGWIEDTYDGTTYTAGSGAISVMGANDLYPTLQWDGTNLNLFWAKYNASSDYGIGWAQSSGNGTWTAKTDVVAHNSINRANVGCSRATDGSRNVGVAWQEATGTNTTWTSVNAAIVTVESSGPALPDPSLLGTLDLGTYLRM